MWLPFLGSFPGNEAHLRVVKMVVLGNGGFVPYRTQGIVTKTAEMTSLHSTHKKRGFGPQNPENDESAENGGCPACKTMIYRKWVCTTPNIDIFWGPKIDVFGGGGKKFMSFFWETEF